MTDSPITQTMLDDYWKNGFVVVPGLLENDDRTRWLNRLHNIVDGKVKPAERMLVMKDIMVAKGAVNPNQALEAIAKIQDFENDPELFSYMEHERVLECVERFIGEEVFALHSMLINKPPNVDGRHPLHQDLLYFPFRPADKIVASWTALEPCTRENGCLVVVPGSHRGELIPHETVEWEWLNGGYFGAKGISANAERVHLEMEPGDTVFFHPILLHGSGRNRTSGFRRAISAHFASLSCTWEWSTVDSIPRPYRILRGSNKGGRWDGTRSSNRTVNPLDYIPRGPFARSGSTSD